MRAERLAWAETPAAKVDVERRKPAAAAAGLVRRRFLHRGGVRVLARTIDAIAVSLVTIGLCFAAGYDVWNVSLAAALPFILLPVAALARSVHVGQRQRGVLEAVQVAVDPQVLEHRPARGGERRARPGRL